MKRLSLVLMLAFASFSVLVAQRSISGTITDESGDALIGATILVKGTTTGAVTDIDGSYSLDVPAGSDVLIFSYTGYGTQEITLGASNVVDLQMAPDAQLLNEVVVTGYSEIERKKLISSVAVVDDAAIENIPLTDVNQLVQGRAPGVFTTANSGQPGAQQQIRIRGTGSITGGRNPLYVIDGIPIEQGNFAQEDGSYNQTDILANLNPNDIANITILKDASATSLYGSRGANGVVLITTKKGKVGKTEVTIKGQLGTTQPQVGNFNMMNPQQWLDYERTVLRNSGLDETAVLDRRPNSLLDNTNDWVDAAFRDGTTYNIEAQARGGNDKTRFFGSVGYFDQEGTQITSQFDRVSARLNVDHFASDKLDFSLNFNSTYTQQNNAVNGNRFQSPMLGAFINPPTQGAVNPATGQLYTGLESDWASITNDNFLYSFPINYTNINQFRLLGKLAMNYNITKNLRFTQTGNVDWITIEEADWNDPTTNDGENLGGSLDNSFRNVRTLTTQSLLKYFTDFGDHSINVLGGFEYQRTRNIGFRAFGSGYASGRLQTLNSAAEANGTPAGSATAYSFVSLLGQANYNFKGKYGIQASFRRDASSRFGANNRWASFWSVGASWNISDEPFMQNGFFDNLRLRVSYGTTGNANGIGNFPSQELYAFDVAYNNIPGNRPSQIGNPDLTWEKNQNGNIGVDFAILNSRIGGTVEIYRRTSTDLLLNVPVSSTSGFTSATRNIGEMKNEGLEITLYGAPFKANTPGGFNWNVDFNISWNRNEITSLPDGEDILNGSQIWRVGKPIRSQFFQEWAGVNPADGTPLWSDGEGGTTGSYNSAPRLIVGNAEPDFIAGLTNSFTFKGFTLSAFIYTAQGHQIYNSSRRFVESDGQRFGWNHIVEAAEGIWTQPGDNAIRPQPLPGGNSAANSRSSRFMEDASFIRLRNLSLGYSLPKSITDRLNLSRVNIYVQGVNLWTQTDYTGFDPEADEDGVEFFRYPVGKSLTLGLDVTF